MPKLYFHLPDGADVLLDPDNVELDLAGLPARAHREARSVMAGEIAEGRLNLDQRVDVENEAGEIIHRLWFDGAVSIKPRA